MKKGRVYVTLAAAWLFLLSVGLFLSCAHAAKDVERITKEELRAVLGNPGYIIIDVRASRDWSSSGRKIKGAVREEPDDAAKWAGKYPKDKAIVLYCA